MQDSPDFPGEVVFVWMLGGREDRARLRRAVPDAGDVKTPLALGGRDGIIAKGRVHGEEVYHTIVKKSNFVKKKY